ncbi:MAG: hypothetical protein ACTHLT_07355 [Devosia sp.]
MSRLASSIATLIAASLSLPAAAADMGEGWDGGMEFRTGYQTYEPKDWTTLGEDDDGIHIETGLRYWYSMGSLGVDGGEATSTAHTGEAFLRIEDDATATYAQGMAGYSMAVTGEFNDGGLGGGDIGDGTIAYAGADFGWNAFNDGQGNGIGGLVGYQYWLEAPDTGRTNFTTLSDGDSVTYDPVSGQTFIPGDSAPNHVDIHAIRLGLQGKANFNNFIDVRAELAAVPYAKVNGVVGVDDPEFSTAVYGGPAQFPYGFENGNISAMRSSETSLDGWGYGAMAEAFVGVHPTENLTFRLGGRAWYVQGMADTTYTRVEITDPSNTDADPEYEGDPVVHEGGVIETNAPFSFLRYGVLAELTYSF